MIVCPFSFLSLLAVNLPLVASTCRSSLSLLDSRKSAKITEPFLFPLISFASFPRFPIRPCSVPLPLKDPVDVILLSTHKLHPGCKVKVRVIAGIETTDEHGQDDKIICVLDPTIDKENTHIKDLNDIFEADEKSRSIAKELINKN